MSPALDFTDNAADDRYEVRLDGVVIGRADYVRDGDRVVIPHTQIDWRHSGEGVGSELVRYALDDIRRRGLKVGPACPFVSHFLTEHPEYADLV